MNGEAKHTPGPWEARDMVGAGLEIHARVDCIPQVKRGFEIMHGSCPDVPVMLFSARWVQFSPDGWDEMQLANAHLIAAAPDLLQACELVAKALESDKSGDVLWACDGNTAWEVLTEAISKAKGE